MRITLTGGTDPDGDTVDVDVQSVTQDEPLNGTGDGDTSTDAAVGSGGEQVLVRAEREGGGDDSFG